MWPFKKKAKEAIPVKTACTSVICIPGIWTDIDEIKNLILSQSNTDYMVVGNILFNGRNHTSYTFEVCEKDERMKKAFKTAGAVTHVTEEFLDAIEKHNCVIYISSETGTLKTAENMALAANAVLKAGGIGIKIESTGKAFEKQAWLDFTANFVESDLYKMFVLDSIVNENGETYSCGMHNLGFKDTIVAGEEFQRAVYLISVFGYYQIIDKPSIFHNQTFQPDFQSPKYRITEETNQPNLDMELFRNPFGMWRLSRIEE